MDEVNVVSFLCQKAGNQFSVPLLQLLQNDGEGKALASTWIFNRESHYFKTFLIFFFKEPWLLLFLVVLILNIAVLETF